MKVLLNITPTVPATVPILSASSTISFHQIITFLPLNVEKTDTNAEKSKMNERIKSQTRKEKDMKEENGSGSELFWNTYVMYFILTYTLLCRILLENGFLIIVLNYKELLPQH